MLGLLVVFLLALPAAALTVDQTMLGAAADESACAVSKASTRFENTSDQVYFRFVARRLRAGDQLAVEWLDPGGQIHASSPYDSLPAASSLCFVTGLPLGGFPASQLPGVWTVRVTSGPAVLASRTFEVTGAIDPSAPRITDIDRVEIEGRHTDLEIRGQGFVSDSILNVAQYTKEGGWKYIAMLIPAGSDSGRMAVRLSALPAAEYLVIVKNPDGRQSSPMRFLVSSPAEYKLPTPGGQLWTITQGPYGGFSHYGRSRHAWDIAPKSGSCIVAMRAGVAHTFDLKLGQTPGRRIFGNYITVQHDDGEYSHYAHLRTGSFRVKEGERVVQGQPLATAGNSGYTVGQGGGQHVHVHVTRALSISSPSLPFRFGDLPGLGYRGGKFDVSSTNAATGDCNSTAGQTYRGSVAVTEVWSQLITAGPRVRSFVVRLEGQTETGALDLSLVSPSGHYYASYADPEGFDPPGVTFRLSEPERGSWRVLVRGMKGSGERVEFRVIAEMAEQVPAKGGIPAARNSAAGQILR
ncbi:MAG: M23 family metallopeptidase [Acidobacteriota bacterium]